MKIIVLMSTYNGEKYLKEQLDSLLNQSLVPSKIIIRDDGSSDNTLNIIKEYANRNTIIDYYQGNNIGPTKSFYELIKNVENADYYALCDQDDVWYKDKLEKAINKLEQEDNGIPLLYAGRFILTDEYLNKLDSNMSKLYSYTDFAHSLIYHTSPGCTFVFNDLTRKQVLKYDMNTRFCKIHDEIIHKVVSMFGKVILDEEPLMYYRQHANNVFGLTANKNKEFFHRIRNFLSKDVKNDRSKIARNLLEVYGSECDKDKKELLNIVGNYVNSNKLKKELLNNELFKTNTINDLFFKILVLANYI